MVVEIGYHQEFARQLKQLSKKYPSLKEDYASFLNSLQVDPLQGVDLGNGVRKIRFAIKSKAKGKSGGARAITYNVEEAADETFLVTLLTIYDKSEIENVSDGYIRQLVATIVSPRDFK